MSKLPVAASPGGSGAAAAPPGTAGMVPVWDPLVRVFHWSLLGLFVIAYASGDELAPLHLAAGYAIMALLALRVVWGFVGPRHARFSDFVRRPRDVRAYLRLAARGRAPRTLGHNPAGGAMTVALMAMLGGVCVTGYLLTGAAWWVSGAIEGLHELLVNLTIVLIGLHLVGNLFSSLAHRENLAMSMVHGMKRPQ